MNDWREEFASLSAKGDSAALALVFSKTSGPLFGFLVSLLKSRQDAEEILQDLFMKLAERGCVVPEPRRIDVWLFRSARNASRFKALLDSAANVDPLACKDDLSSFKRSASRLCECYATVFQKRLAYQCLHQSAALSLARAAFKADKGVNPPSAEALVPSQFAALPVFPLTGKTVEFSDIQRSPSSFSEAVKKALSL